MQIQVCMGRKARRGVVLTIAAVVCASALAAPKRFEADQFLVLAEEAAQASSRLFDLARLSVPLCPDRVYWASGPASYFVLPTPFKSEVAERTRQLVMSTFGAEAGEQVVLANYLGTPLAAAGLVRGDRFRVPPVQKAEGTQAPANGTGLTAEERLAQARQTLNERFSREPVQRQVVRRGDQSMEVSLEYVRACHASFQILNSEYRYANASWSEVQFTRPFLKQLDDAGLTMALAHETAQILSGFTELNRVNRAAGVLGALLGSSGRNAANSELGKGGVDEDSLIQIDRLTAMLIDVYGLSALDFKHFLERRLAEKEDWFRPSYVSTRTVTPKRLQALDELHAMRSKGEGWPRPEYVPDTLFDAFQEFLARAKQLRQTK